MCIYSIIYVSVILLAHFVHYLNLVTICKSLYILLSTVHNMCVKNVRVWNENVYLLFHVLLNVESVRVEIIKLFNCDILDT